MKENKLELTEEELDQVTGGLPSFRGRNNTCPMFMRAEGKLFIKKCENCFYYHKKGNRYYCDSPKSQMTDRDLL